MEERGQEEGGLQEQMDQGAPYPAQEEDALDEEVEVDLYSPFIMDNFDLHMKKSQEQDPREVHCDLTYKENYKLEELKVLVYDIAYLVVVQNCKV